jgi:integrase
MQTRGNGNLISEKIVAALPVPETGNKLHYFSGATLQGSRCPSGFAVRVTAAGSKAFVWFHRVDGKGHLETIGSWRGNPAGGDLPVLDAIVKCIDRAKLVAKGVDKKGNDVDPLPDRTRRGQEAAKPAKMDVAALIDQFVARYVEKAANLRSGDQIKVQFDRLVKPRIGTVGIYDLKRSMISKMLDEIADENGPRMADLSLAYIRKAFNWYEINGHDDDFKSPIVRGMARQKPSERERERILADDEIRDLWAALETVEPVCFRSYVKTLLLTATRRTEAADMIANELDGDLWVIPKARYKTKRDHVIPLSAAARELIGSPEGFVFSTTKGEKAFAGFGKSKAELDKAIAVVREEAGRPPMEAWTFHDLRRTARTLMSRAGVQPDHGERCLGHVIAGVRGTYDRFAYLDEKRDAFEKLARMIAVILDPPAVSNVTPMRRSQ